jgi:dimethylhistidine N-methyltransferase
MQEPLVPNDAGIPPQPAEGDVAGAALAGLMATQKTLPPWLFYDQEGCRLFYEITRLPEYYLTRTETALLTTRAAEMVPAGLTAASLIEFGASSEAKASHLLNLSDASGRPIIRSYLPIDVARAELLAMQARLHRSHPGLDVQPIVADFMRPVSLPPLDGPRLGFFPGSTIGNLDPHAATEFLGRVRDAIGLGSWLLLGADLRKDASILLPAYNDAAGVTAAFNLNLLRRLNREAGATFDLAAFRHEAIWNDRLSRIEMHLISEADQVVSVAGHRVTFHRGETIHTENSYKHPEAQLIDLARSGGWALQQRWSDPSDWFGVFLFRAE